LKLADVPHVQPAAMLFGSIVSLVTAVTLLRVIRADLLLDPDPYWAISRYLLWLFVISITVCSAGLATALFLIGGRRGFFSPGAEPLPFRRATILLLATGAVIVGVVLRFVALERIPPSLWLDDVSLIAPTLALQGGIEDFADPVRPAPYGVSEPYGTVGVLYLEVFRLVLRLFGTTVLGVRFLSAAAGALSIVTALLLGRELLPRGGGTLAGLVAAGLRWSLLLSRWGWVAIVLAPLSDVAALFLLRARRRRRILLAAASGLVTGIATHVYLAAWIVAAALFLLALWPDEWRSSGLSRLRLALVFAAAFGLAAAPLFLLGKERTAPYFARVSGHNLWREVQYRHSFMPAFAAVADSLTAPWFGIDPFAHHDLPGKTRLGWVLGIPVAVAFGRSLLRPRDPFSAFLLAEGGAAFAASVAGGHAGLPNSYRFGYLTTVTAVAAAGGILSILEWLPAARRRVAAFAAVGILSVSGALAARDALLRWPALPQTFDGLHGQDTLLSRAMIRWERYGDVRVSPDLKHSLITVEGIRRYRLDPDLAADTLPGRAPAAREFRFVPPGVAARPGERLVERIGDAWGREWAWVYGASRQAQRACTHRSSPACRTAG
jgi:hypothetical protein